MDMDTSNNWDINHSDGACNTSSSKTSNSRKNFRCSDSHRTKSKLMSKTDVFTPFFVCNEILQELAVWLSCSCCWWSHVLHSNLLVVDWISVVPGVPCSPCWCCRPFCFRCFCCLLAFRFHLFFCDFRRLWCSVVDSPDACFPAVAIPWL